MTDLLSVNARMVLGGTFAWDQVITYHMVQSVPSPEMQAALDELVTAGMIKAERGLPDMTEIAVRYRLAEGIDVTPFRHEAWEAMGKSDAPAIRIYIPKDASQ